MGAEIAVHARRNIRIVPSNCCVTPSAPAAHAAVQA